MKRNGLKKGLIISTAALTALTVLTGCGANSEGSEDVTKVIVGSGTSYAPYAYLDESGKAVGYEYDLLAEIDELLPQYEFEYQSMTFDNLILSLDSGKIDLAAHQYEYTEEREQKYLFASEPYTHYVTYITVLSSDTEVQSLADLKGKKVWTGGTTSASTSLVQKWNNENPDSKVEIISGTATAEETVEALKSGKYAAAVLNDLTKDKYNKEYGNGTEFLKQVGEPINESETYYLYRKDETELQTAVDGALKELRENGTLSELSIKWLGKDYTGSGN